jgi:hypothetical protein
MRLAVTALILIVLSAASLPAVAQDTKSTEPQTMPQMGPPEEMKQVAFLVGTWDFTMKMKMNPADTFWMETKGTTKNELVFGGVALMSTIEELMMGAPFVAGSLMCYDRETKKWQMTWTDNLAPSITIYTGTRTETGSIFFGEASMEGKTHLYRMTTSNQTPTSYDFKGEMSMDGGKTWVVWATAKYAKRK